MYKVLYCEFITRHEDYFGGYDILRYTALLESVEADEPYDLLVTFEISPRQTGVRDVNIQTRKRNDLHFRTLSGEKSTHQFQQELCDYLNSTISLPSNYE